jgi:hypothetical protein
MNRSIKLLIVAHALAFASLHATEPQVQDLPLDDHMVYSVPVSALRVTTISFPSPISAIDGAMITADGKTPGLYQIAHVNGTAYFSVRALAQGAITNINVRWNDRTYVFELHENTESCCYSLILRDDSANTAGIVRPLTPNRLMGLLDKAKAFPLLQQYHPDVIQNAEHRDYHAQPLVSDCGDYEVKLTEAFRFPKDDTLIFQLAVLNKIDKPLQHSPERLEVHAGSQVFYPSLADLPTIVGPHGTATGYVAITGTPDGGRNNLSLKNDFTFAVARLDPKVEAAVHGFDSLQTMGLQK